MRIVATVLEVHESGLVVRYSTEDGKATLALNLPVCANSAQLKEHLIRHTPLVDLRKMLEDFATRGVGQTFEYESDERDFLTLTNFQVTRL